MKIVELFRKIFKIKTLGESLYEEILFEDRSIKKFDEEKGEIKQFELWIVRPKRFGTKYSGATFKVINKNETKSDMYEYIKIITEFDMMVKQ